jgi:hypothetical protein
MAAMHGRRAPSSLLRVLTLPLVFGQQRAPQHTPSSLASPSLLTFSPRTRVERSRAMAGPAELPAIACALPLRRLYPSQLHHRVLQFAPPPPALSGSITSHRCSSHMGQLPSAYADKRPTLHAASSAKPSLADPPQHHYYPLASLAHRFPASLGCQSVLPPPLPYSRPPACMVSTL